jgi:DNA polymerase-1
MALHPEYKAQRPEMPHSLEQQLDQIIAYLRASHVFSLTQDNIEADDCIAALTQQAVAEGLEVVIASSDKDFMQLVSPRVSLLNPKRKKWRALGRRGSLRESRRGTHANCGLVKPDGRRGR